jgi:uncharacterized membrane protein
MSQNQPLDEKAVDRRAETVVTQQPGYAATEQVTRDVAQERRLWSFQLNRIIYTVLGILEILLGLRFVLKLLAADAAAGFAGFIYGITGLFVAPFDALFGTPTAGGAILETNTLVAMLVYALLFWIVVRVILIATDRPTARTVTRSTHEQTPDSEKTTHTNQSG